MGDFKAEKQLLKGMKLQYLAFVDQVMQKFGDGTAGEQEILMTLADMVIHIFAMESAVLRAEKALVAVDQKKQELYRAGGNNVWFQGEAAFCQCSRKNAPAFLGDATLLHSFAAATTYTTGNLLAAKRLVADATSHAEKYIF